MRSFDRLHPLTVITYFLLTAVVVLSSADPILSMAFALSSLFLYGACAGRRAVGATVFFLCMCATGAMLSPFFTSGTQVLFTVFGRSVTLEAVLSGARDGGVFASVIFWFLSCRLALSDERLFAAFGRRAPRTALVLIMALGFLPTALSRYRKILDARHGIGIGTEKRRLGAAIEAFGILIADSFERAIVKADSMRARGYASGERTSVTVCRFSRRDALFAAFVLVFFAGIAVPLAFGAGKYRLTPTLMKPPTDVATICYDVSATLLFFLGPILCLKEEIAWHGLCSKI